MNNLVWIAVPNGRVSSASGTELSLRVAILPRLDSPTLAEAGMSQWPPPELASATLIVDFAAQPGPATASLTARQTSTADSTLWPQLFPNNIRIDPVSGDEVDQREIRVRSASSAAGAAESIYNEAARASIDVNGAGLDKYSATVAHSLAAHPIEPPNEPPKMFPARSRRVEPPDFHTMIALLREHPNVLLALGLILDLRITVAPGSVLPAAGVLMVRWSGVPSGIPAITTPWTKYEFDADRFCPASTPSIEAGMLAITDAAPGGDAPAVSEWRTFTVDIEASTGRLLDAAFSAAQNSAGAALPALRSGGIALARTTLAEQMNGRRVRAAAHREAGEERPLDADDLLLGYRVDVKRGGGEWCSLMARDATYSLTNGTVLGQPNLREEGHLKPHAAFDYGDNVLRTDDVIARWTGWSLSVNRPALDGRSMLAPSLNNRTGSGLNFQFEAAGGTLPRLRFGGSYQLRIRTADITGGGLALGDPHADRNATPPIKYGRFEPISAPNVSLPDGVTESSLGPAETILDVVVRSDRGMDAEQFATANPKYLLHVSRKLTPPSVSLGLAETHKVFDNPAVDNHWSKVQSALVEGPDGLSLLSDPAAGGIAAALARASGAVSIASPSDWPEWPVSGSKQMTVNPTMTANPASLTWQGGELVITVGQAADIVVELSSSLKEDFLDHFAASDLFSSASETAALSGRHPLRTPGRSVRVTHAVRKPLSDPAGTLAPTRSQGYTYAALAPQPPLLGLDVPSTAKLEITASWTEPADEKQISIENRPVEVLSLDATATSFREAIRHEFGDTRHRKIVYQLTAVSRFRQFFAPHEAAQAFLVTAKLAATDIPSSARPPAPVVSKVFPAFAWNERSESAPGVSRVIRTRNCFVRVALERPWFSSGEGEALAVITPSPGYPLPADNLLTQVGGDPLWNTPVATRYPESSAFATAGSPGIRVALPGTDDHALAVPYAVWFDSDSGHWYSDIALPTVASATYAPLVQLALARFQPHSIEGLELSRIVQADFVPLLPSRTLTVERTGNQVSATLSGIGPTGSRANKVRFVLERSTASGMDAAALTSLLDDTTLTLWQAVGEPPQPIALGVTANLTLPASSGSYRIRVREIEDLPKGPASADDSELGERTVFLDATLVPAPNAE